MALPIADRPDTGWRSLALKNSYTGTAEYRILDGRTYVRGKLTPGTLTDATVLFTLPEDARLTNPLTFAVVPADNDSITGAPARLEVQADGDVAIYNGTGAVTISLAGLSWFQGE